MKSSIVNRILTKHERMSRYRVLKYLNKFENKMRKYEIEAKVSNQTTDKQCRKLIDDSNVI